jgi:predicted RNA-binding protein with PUA-like domain
MNYWLIKSEPSVFSIDDMKAKGTDAWDGVRNYQARNFMKQMKKHDLCFFYHSNTKHVGIVGIVEVAQKFYPDPADERFVLVDMTYIKHLPFISLDDLKGIPQLRALPLFKQSRLSVQPVDKASANVILNLNPSN